MFKLSLTAQTHIQGIQVHQRLLPICHLRDDLLQRGDAQQAADVLGQLRVHTHHGC